MSFAGVNSLGDLGRLLEELPRPFVDFLKVQAIIRGAATRLGSSLHDRLRINATYAQKVTPKVSLGQDSAERPTDEALWPCICEVQLQITYL